MQIAPRVLLYAGFIFVSSGLLLVLHIFARRLIAPYVGVSLYTWTSIIGLFLVGLSPGNWIGGVRADRGAGEGRVGVIVADSFHDIAAPYHMLTAEFIARVRTRSTRFEVVDV